MNTQELAAFEKGLQNQLKAFSSPKPARPAKRPSAARAKGITVILCVRKQRIALDDHFVFESNTISKLEARIQAERAAREAGWPIIGVVYDYQYP